jgi:hypothetical protein
MTPEHFEAALAAATITPAAMAVPATGQQKGQGRDCHGPCIGTCGHSKIALYLVGRALPGRPLSRGPIIKTDGLAYAFQIRVGQGRRPE